MVGSLLTHNIVIAKPEMIVNELSNSIKAHLSNMRMWIQRANCIIFPQVFHRVSLKTITKWFSHFRFCMLGKCAISKESLWMCLVLVFMYLIKLTYHFVPLLLFFWVSFKSGSELIVMKLHWSMLERIPHSLMESDFRFVTLNSRWRR